MRLPVSIAGHALIILCAATLPLVAQDDPEREGPTVLTLVPYAGGHLPTRMLLVDQVAGGGWDAELGYLIGARLEIPVRSRLAAHLDAGYAHSWIRGVGAAYGTLIVAGHFVGLSGRLAYEVVSPRSPVSLTLVGGGGWIRHWISSPNPLVQNWPAAVGAVQIGWRVSRDLTLITGAELWLYSADFKGANTAPAAQRDLRLSLGIK
jgi:hypothetical protein